MAQKTLAKDGAQREPESAGSSMPGKNLSKSPLAMLVAKAKEIQKNGVAAAKGSDGAFVGVKKKRKSPQKRLIEAIQRMSVDEARQAIADGADPWITTCFYGEHGIVGDQAIAGCDESEITALMDWPSDDFNTSAAWERGVEKVFGKNPKAVADMAEFLDGLGCFFGAIDRPGWIWVEGSRPSQGQGRNRAPDLIAKERRKMLADWSANWSGIASTESKVARGLIIASTESKIARALISVAKRWHEEPEAVGGLPAMEWRKVILGEMNNNPAAGWGASWEMMANFSGDLEAPMSANDWEQALSCEENIVELAHERSWIKALLKIQVEPIQAAQVNKLMAVAVSLNDVRLLGLVASKSCGVDWVEGPVSQRAISLLVRAGEQKGLVSMLALGLITQKRVTRSGKVLGRECFEALASVPEAVDAAMQTPSPGAMARIDECELEELSKRFPGIEAPDKDGNNVAHWWARAADDDKGKRRRFIKLLNSPMRHLALDKNSDGQTPLAILLDELSDEEKKKWNKKFAAWEASGLAAAAPSAAATGSKKRTAL